MLRAEAIREVSSEENKKRYTCEEVCLFLADYASTLLGCAATCMRLERNLDRMATAFGKRVDIYIMPRHVNMTVSNPDGSGSFTAVWGVKPLPISFTLNTRLSQLSWHVADDRLTLATARKRFRHIVSSEKETNWKTLSLASLANASFCGIFGGDCAAMLIVAVATALGFRLKQFMGAAHIDSRIIFFLCAFVSTVAAASAYILTPGGTPSVAVGTSVLYLVPGIPFLNSFNDMVYRHYVCAFSRFMDAAVLTASLSAGLCLGMLLMRVSMF